MGEANDQSAVMAGFEGSPSMTFVAHGEQLIVTAANAAMRAGFPRERMIGVPLREVFSEIAGQRGFEHYDQVMRTGVPVEHREFRFEVHRGTPAAVEVYVDFSIAPLKDDLGRTQGVVCEVRDATERVLERRAAEGRAARAEARYAETVDLVRTLQDAMLPDGVPILPQLDFAATYLLAETDTTAGGDWLDAVPLAEGRWAVVVGDVVGHGVEASVTMGRLRAALRAALCVHDDPADALRVLDRYVATEPSARAATVAVAVIDPASGVVQYCTAGHPAPLLVPSAAQERFLPTTGSGPLGSGTTFHTREAVLEVGDVLLLYTDGIVERPGRGARGSSAELRQVVSDVVRHRPWRIGTAAAAFENVCHTVVELLVRESGYDDDVTMVALQRTAPVPELGLTDVVDSATPFQVRASVSEWLARLGVSGRDRIALLHAADELVANVVDHAYVDGGGSDIIEIGARLTDDSHVELSVRDYGRWRPEPPASAPDRHAGRGRGLLVARGLVDSLTVERGAVGTTAHVRQRVERPVVMMTALAHAPAAAAPREELEVVRTTVGIEVRGALDTAAARRLASELARSGGAGGQTVVVDLGGTTHISSAAIQVLLGFLLVNPGSRLLAPAGTVAQHVLSIAQVEHETEHETEQLDR